MKNISDFESYAEQILETYMPEHLEKEGQLDIIAFAEAVGVKIEYLRLSESLDEEPILGLCLFKDDEVEVYQPEIDAFKRQKLKAGTVIIDSLMKEVRGEGCFRNTLVHECVHWIKDKDSYLEAAACSGEIKSEEVSRIEYEVQHITPRILMPKKPFIACAKRTLKLFKQICPEAFRNGACFSLNPRPDCDTYPLREYIKTIAEIFGTSSTSTEIRLKELGFYYVKNFKLYRTYL